MRRFFSQTPLGGTRAVIGGQEAAHMVRVLRLRPGDEVVLFDGSGDEWQAVVERVGRGEVELSLKSQHRVDRESRCPIQIGVALPKGDRQRWLVEKAVELGVARLVALKSSRSVVEPSPAVVERLQRYVIEASKQCGRNRLMQVDWQPDLSVFLQDAPSDAARWFAHADPPSPGIEQCVSALQQAPPRQIWAAVGPEGGWTPEEVRLAHQAGWQPVNLGPRTLRIETAVCVLATVASLIVPTTQVQTQPTDRKSP
ncbi:MAG: ribosomal RNA small subunit methyltransferase E [Pirellulaceae bacterium]|nr:MAG: ribosomal RNA small subunit methyltransferase E [Pirellulaceae bacterium]